MQYIKQFWYFGTVPIYIDLSTSLKHGFNSCYFRGGSEMEEVTGKISENEEKESRATGAMLWSIQEALEKQTLQIGASACGATAVVDVLKALKVDVAPKEADRCVKTCLRRNEAPLPDYLLSRSEAGECPKNIIQLQLVIIKTHNLLLNVSSYLSRCNSCSAHPGGRGGESGESVGPLLSPLPSAKGQAGHLARMLDP